jgi:hypothetical protein
MKSLAKRLVPNSIKPVSEKDELPVQQQGLATTFPDTEQSLADYEAGKFCYHPTGGGGPLDSSFFGETCIPKAYVLNRWTKYFEFLDFIDDERCLQSVIVVKKA